MHVRIDLTGKHEIAGVEVSGVHGAFVMVDGEACVVDLSGIPGPAQDPDVRVIDWNDRLVNTEAQFVLDPRTGYTVRVPPDVAGRMFRQPRGTAQSVVQTFSDPGLISPYVAAFRARRTALR